MKLNIENDGIESSDVFEGFDQSTRRKSEKEQKNKCIWHMNIPELMTISKADIQ